MGNSVVLQQSQQLSKIAKEVSIAQQGLIINRNMLALLANGLLRIITLNKLVNVQHALLETTAKKDLTLRLPALLILMVLPEVQNSKIVQ